MRSKKAIKAFYIFLISAYFTWYYLHVLFSNNVQNIDNEDQLSQSAFKLDSKEGFWTKMKVSNEHRRLYNWRSNLAMRVCKAELGVNEELKGAIRDYNWTYHKPLLWFDNEHRVIYRDNAKVATNTMAYLLLKSKSDYMSNKKGYDQASLRNRYFGAPENFHLLQDAFRDYFSFIIARHPLDRAVSAYYEKVRCRYQTKIVRSNTEHTLTEFQERIITDIRSETFTRATDLPTESEYILGLWSEARRMGGIHKYGDSLFLLATTQVISCCNLN